MLRVSAAIARAIDALQERVQRDEGRRGIGVLVQHGQLLSAARTLVPPAAASASSPSSPPNAAAEGVLILTGFPCLRERTPPIESDGPPGAIAIALTMLALSRRPVTVLTEAHSAHVLERCASAGCIDPGMVPEVAAFPTSDGWGCSDDARLDALRSGASTVVSIERAGDSADGTCYTMRGFPMGPSLLGKINTVAAPGRGLATIGIGDGGNELGMGSMHAQICEHIPLGPKIGCVVAADAPLVASVSNWGGYALSCATALLAWDAGLGLASGAEAAPEGFLNRLVQDEAMAEATLHACNEAGAVDGITAEGGGSVDGMPCDVQLGVLADLRRISLEAMRASPHGASQEQAGA